MRALWVSTVAWVALLGGCGESKPSSWTGRGDAGGDATVHPETGVCVPVACDTLTGPACGDAPDGCGGVIHCGTCAEGATCGAAGPNRCGTGTCVPKSCQKLGASCGQVSDGCASMLECGTCPVPTVCGGGGTEHQCGCVAKSCAQLGAQCGTALDGCAGEVQCGTCAPGQTCGGGGPNQCGTGACSPGTCATLGASCGLISDKCSGVLDCGACQNGVPCGGAGKANQCGCVAKSCEQLGASCGALYDGCETIQCGTCSLPDTCGGGGVDNRCGCVCQRAHAATGCLAGVCSIVSCEAGWGDCDGNEANGCETSTASDPAHCGSCSHACAGVLPTCAAGVCGSASCASGMGDCDSGQPGCETDLNTSASHCGGCGQACSGNHIQALCSSGDCTGSCLNGWADCNKDKRSDGCERPLGTTSDCTGCGDGCSPNETCTPAGCRCGDSGLDCAGVDVNYCCTNAPAGCYNVSNNAWHCGTGCAVCGEHQGCGDSQCQCHTDYGDCDGDPKSCETYLPSSAQHCGACHNDCGPNADCNGGTCGCTAYQYQDCNSTMSDGCETYVCSETDCGQCGNDCGYYGYCESCSYCVYM